MVPENSRSSASASARAVSSEPVFQRLTRVVERAPDDHPRKQCTGNHRAKDDESEMTSKGERNPGHARLV